VPIMRDADGHLRGVEAVIDKDHASALLATRLGAERLVITTGVAQVQRGFRTAHAVALGHTSPSELRPLLAAGEFPAGSMGPKIEAALDFLDHGGREVIIARPEDLALAIERRAGTRIPRDIEPDPFAVSIIATKDPS